MTEYRDESSIGEDYDPVPDAGQPVLPSVEDTVPQVHDVTGPLADPEDFDIDAFLEGARPTRRAVMLYMRADLVGVMEQMAAEIDQLGDEDSRLEPKVAEFMGVRDAFYASGRVWVVEGRSYEWVKKVRFDVVHNEFGLKVLDDDAGTISQGPRRFECLAAASAELLAGQIVTPASGVTREKLLRLAEQSPTEYRKLLAAQSFANNALAETAKVLTRDFSRASSTTTSTS